MKCALKIVVLLPPGQPQVLKEVNLEVPSGTFVGIVGQAVVVEHLDETIASLYDPGEGRILIDGYDIERSALFAATSDWHCSAGSSVVQRNRERKHRAHQP